MRKSAMMSDRDDDFKDSFYYRAIRTRIGAALRAQFDMSQPLPDRITALLAMLGKETEVPADHKNTDGGMSGEPARDARR
jgi:hypothetical protein